MVIIIFFRLTDFLLKTSRGISRTRIQVILHKLRHINILHDINIGIAKVHAIFTKVHLHSEKEYK